MLAHIIKITYYVEITDGEFNNDFPYVWQSDIFNTEEEATDFGENIVKKIKENDIDYIIEKGYFVNNKWQNVANTGKRNLGVYIMEMDWYAEDAYDINQVKELNLKEDKQNELSSKICKKG